LRRMRQDLSWALAPGAPAPSLAGRAMFDRLIRVAGRCSTIPSSPASVTPFAAHQSVRETKRLLTLWAFYLKLLPGLLPKDATSSAQFGRDVLTLAQILTRWPALVPKLGPAASPESGLRELIEAAKSSAVPARVSPWHQTLRHLGLDGDEYHASCESLRKLLNLYGNEEVAYYAECVL